MQRTILAVLLTTMFAGCEAVQSPSPDAAASGETVSAPASASANSTNQPLAVDPGSVDVNVATPTADQPVAWGVAVQPSEVAPGDTAVLVVRGHILSPWHIYASEGPVGVGVRTEIQLQLPEGIRHGPWVLPESHTEESPLGPMALYEGDVRFATELHIAADAAPGEHQMQVTIKFQACNQSQCLPPSTENVPVTLTVKAP